VTRKQQVRNLIDAELRRRQGLLQRDATPTHCRGITHLGEPCRWRARASGFCHWHERQQLA
jgi:hypothetical protein